MARFFVTASNIFGGVAYLDGKDLEHIKALRIKRGETFTVCGGGRDYVCRIDGEGAGSPRVKIISAAASRGEPAISCAVYAAFSKSDRLETVIQKTVELGASRIVVFPSSRCVSRPEGVSLLRKTARWNKISEEAAKQSGRGRIPKVSIAPSFVAAVRSAAKADLPLFFYEEERALGFSAALQFRENPETVSVFTGPEDGFTPEEAAEAVLSGMLSVTMGPRILRCETAPVCAISAVMFYTGNL